MTIQVFLNSMYTYHQTPPLLPCMTSSAASYRRNYPVFSGNIPSFVTHGTYQDYRQNKEDDRASTAAWVGGIATIFLAGAAAFVGKNYRDAEALLNESLEFQQRLDRGECVLPPGLKMEFTPIFNKHIAVLTTQRDWGRNMMYCTGTGLAAAVAAFVGGIFAVQWLITAAATCAVFTAAVAAFGTVSYLISDDLEMPYYMLTQLEKIRQKYGL